MKNAPLFYLYVYYTCYIRVCKPKRNALDPISRQAGYVDGLFCIYESREQILVVYGRSVNYNKFADDLKYGRVFENTDDQWI